jgi:hypothetical protein
MKNVSRILFLCAATLLVGCIKDIHGIDEESYDPAAPVRFVTNTATRGAIVDNVSKMTTMGVFCSYTGTTDWTDEATLGKMFNQQLNYNSGKWEYPTGHEQYWGADNLTDRYTFFAYAPYGTGVYDASTNTSGNGLVVSGSSASTGVPSLTYSVPVKVENQPDLMVAVPKKNVRPTGAAVALSMKHALTSVAFQIAGDGDKVKGIAITGVSVSGTLSVDGETVTWSGLGAATTTDFSASLNYDEGQNYYTTTETMSTNLIAGDGYLMMIPQTLTADAKVIVTMDDDTTKELTLGTTTWTAGQRITYNITMPQGPPDGGVIAAPGVIGYIKGTNTLTLKGSKEYAANPDIQKYADDYCGGLSDSTVYVAYFKFGSLIATSSDPNDMIADKNMLYFHWNDVVAAPDEWKGSLREAKDYIHGAWDLIPAYDADVSDTSKLPVSSPDYQSPSAGLGDPCAYYTKYFGSNWVIPKGNPYNGYSKSDLTWYKTDDLGIGIPAGMLSTKSGETGMFYPATGYRGYMEYDHNGNVANQGYSGYYWSAMASNILYGYYMISNNTASLSETRYKNYGHAIRCVPKSWLGISVFPKTDTFAAAGETKQFTVSTYYFTGAVDVSLTAGTEEWLTYTLDGSTLSLTAVANTATTSRTATITLTANTTSTKLIVWQDGDVVLEGGQADILYFDTADYNRLKIGRWDNSTVTVSNIVFTQFGSVIGFTGVGDWNNTTSILFNPTATASYAYGSIPNYNAWNATTPADSPLVSSEEYHNGTNIQAGRGDICRLVGLIAFQAKAMTAEELDAYQSGWRLPTLQENRIFARIEPDNTDPNFDFILGYYTFTKNGLNASNPATGTFLKNKYYIAGSNDVTLPAAGYRNSDGSVVLQGSLGSYSSSCTDGSGNAQMLYFDTSSLSPGKGFGMRNGTAIRCISTGETPTPIITVSPDTYTFPTAGKTNRFTVTTANYTGAVDVSQTAGTDSWLTYTLSGSNLYLIAAANSGDERTSTITLTAGTATTKLIVSQNAAPQPTITVSPGTATFAATGETKTFTVTATNFSGTPTVTAIDNATSSTASWITSASVSGSTLSVVVAANTGAERTATITLTAGTATTKLIVSQNEYVEGGRADIMYFDTSDGNRLKIGRWGSEVTSISNVVLTQFGSVIGLANAGAWDNTASIMFNPTSTASYAYSSIPIYNAWNTSVADSPLVYDAAYHNGTNIKAGRGDICKLVGLTSAEVQATSAQQLSSYKSGWRLPTLQENRVFVGTSADKNSGFSATSGYYTRTEGSTTDPTNPAIGTFPKNKYYTAGGNDAILPATGSRKYDTGALQYNGLIGDFWSATPASTNSGYDFMFNANMVNGDSSYNSRSANAVRCISTGETPTPVPQPVPNGGVIAPPGVIGYIKGTNTLTIRGSKEYSANPDITAYAQTIDSRGLETETVYVAYFKSGSLVAISSDPNDQTADANGHYFQSADIIAVPDEWMGSLDAAKQSIGTSWANIPNAATSDSGTTINFVDASYATGDPCTYYIGSGWAMPQGITSYNGYSVSDLTWNAADALGEGIPAGGLSTKSGETGIFYPAAGHRDMSNGQVGSQDTSGFYWSNRAKDSGNTYYMYLNSSNTNVSNSSVSTYGYAVRCVRASTITVSARTATFAGEGETQQFTVTTTNFPGTPTVTQTDGTSSWLTPTLSGSTLSVTATENTATSERSATITLTAGTATAKLIVSQESGPTITVSPTTATFAGSESTKSFTVTTNYSATIGVTQTNGTSSWLMPTLSDSTLSVAVSPNSTSSSRTASIILTAGSATATVTITQLGNGGENHVLYFTGDAQYPLKVGRWETSLTAEDNADGVIQLTDANNDIDNLAFFKFGSVIGFNRGGDFTLDCIKFNPSTLTVGTDITGYTHSGIHNTLPSIPGYSESDWDNNILNVSDRTTYHTEANLRAGKGDPCQLAGIDMTRLNESGYLANYNSGWHLPTSQENSLFIGVLPDKSNNFYETTSGYYQISPASGWTSSTPNNGIFPASPARAEDPILPVTSGRGSEGKTGPNDRTTGGCYWTSDVFDTWNFGVSLFFDSTYVVPYDGNDSQNGFPIRCVKAGLSEPELEPEPIITVDPTTATFAAAGETKTFTVETIHFVGNIDVSQTAGTSSWLTYTLNGSTLSLTAAANTASTERMATITLTAGTATTKLIVSQNGIPAAPDGSSATLAPPGVIGYIKGTNTLTLRGSKEYANNPDIKQFALDNFGGLENKTVYAAYFPFGSLVGISSDPTDATADASGNYFQSDDIVAAPDEWKGSLQGARDYIGTDWDNIPTYTADWSFMNVSDPDYQSPSTAKGDPCMYYFGTKYGGGWMLPTYRHEANHVLAYDDYDPSNLIWKETNALGTDIPAGALSTKMGETGMFYPAAGMRYSQGRIDHQGVFGDYRTSSAGRDGGLEAQKLHFEDGRVYTGDVYEYSIGHTVRCVQPYPPAITVSPTSYTFGSESGNSNKFPVATTYFDYTPTVTLSEGASTWLSAWLSGVSVGWNLVVNTTAANTATTARTATITLTADTATATVTISQDGYVAPAPDGSAATLAPPGVIGYIKGTNILTLRGSKEYSSNTAIANYAKTIDSRGLESETVYIANFKFYSLVAISSDATDTWSSPYFDAEDIVAAPNEWKGSLQGARDYIGSDWTKVPSPTTSTVSSDLANGFGDPCTYYFGSGWKTPIGNPYNGYAESDLTWKAAGVLDTGIPGGVLSGKSGESGIFFPATGSRSVSTGALGNVGSYGAYWSGTPGSATGGYDLLFDGGSILPSDNTNRSSGCAVRCVRE